MRRFLLQATVYFTAFIGAASLFAQSEPSSDQSEATQGQKILDSNTSYWRFGLSIINPGQAQGIVATSPIPIECPEQTVELIQEEFGDGVKGVKLKSLKPLARQLVFKIASLQPGQGGTTALTFKISKRQISLPSDTKRFTFEPKPRGSLKKDFLGPSPFIESKDKKIIAIAEDLAKQHADKPAWNQVEAIYDWVRENVEYEFDKQIHSCLDALDAGKGDCEELSSLFIAICRARDIPARAVWIPGHTYPEFYLLDENGDGHWFPCQAAGTRQFGEMNERRPVLQKGDRFKVSGQKELQRYAQPTLKCKDATAALSIEQIAEELEAVTFKD
jgi:hypothetical protein